MLRYRQPSTDDTGMLRRCALWLVALGLLLVPVRPRADQASAIDLLDRYAHGEFAAVVSALGNLKDFDGLRKQLQNDGPAWIDASDPATRPRRELAAATFALEAARADEWHEWKFVQKGGKTGGFLPFDTLYWKAPPLLITWGASLLRSPLSPLPATTQRLWQFAAIAVAERAEDFEFLIGSPFETRIDPGDEIAYVKPLLQQFPDEPRFLLAEAIALEWRTWPQPGRDGTREARTALEALSNDESVGAEALVRLGDLELRGGAAGEAIPHFERAETLTRDPYLVYLARFLKGQAFERQKKTAEAIRAYRGALAAVPGAQSASVALAALLFLSDQRTEAAVVLTANLSGGPQPVDPWRTMADGDDRFWPEIIGRLRAEIATASEATR
jgi:tetratricopeptide (TPR) repeat protein